MRKITEKTLKNGQKKYLFSTDDSVKTFSTYNEADEYRRNYYTNKKAKIRPNFLFPDSIIEVLNLTVDNCDMPFVVEHFEENFTYIISHYSPLDERELFGIKAFYFEGKLQKNIASDFNVSSSRAGEIIARAIRKLKRYTRILKIGYKNYLLEQDIEILQVQLIDKKKALLSQLNNDDIITKEDIEEFRNYKIENCNFIARTYNCLKRAGIKTLHDLENYSECDILKIQNLGRKSAKEVKNKLAEYGLKLKED